MKVARRDGTAVIVLDDGPPVHFCKPAVDPLFASAAEVWGSWNLALILTGMGTDGTDGRGGHRQLPAAASSRRTKRRSVVWGMPGSAVAGRRLLGGAAARSDRAEGHAHVPRGEAMTPVGLRFPAQDC